MIDVMLHGIEAISIT